MYSSYVMSEDEIRSVCRRYVASFAKNYNGNGKPIYASKAFSCKEIYRIVLSEGLDVEVVSGGELYTALQAGVPGSQIHFQGNNKSAGELTMAVENGVGDIVVDNLYELERLNAIAGEHSMVAPISFRIKPGIDAHTHEFIRTGKTGRTRLFSILVFSSVIICMYVLLNTSKRLGPAPQPFCIFYDTESRRSRRLGWVILIFTGLRSLL